MLKTFVALDGMTDKQAIDLITQYPKISNIKIGLELYLKYGRKFVEQVAAIRDIGIFLDLKLHDIPTTVAKAVAALKGLPITFLTVHATGGKEMLNCAQESIEANIPKCKILAVTILTSHDDSQIHEIWGRNKEESLTSLLSQIHDSGVAGLVCSGADLKSVKEFETKNHCRFIKVTPGIRLAGDSNNDQVRVMTPKEAVEAGSDYLVVGRSITTNPEVINQEVFP